MNSGQYNSSGLIHRQSLGWILVFGLLYVFVIPPFQSPDEPNHFLRAYQISEGQLFPEKTDNRLGGILPRSLDHLIDSFAFLKNNYNARLGEASWGRAFEIPLDRPEKQFHDFVNTAIYAPLGYLPQVIGITVVRALGGNPLQLLYAARISNFLCWFGLLILTLRLLPTFAQVFVGLAWLPATLVMSASANGEILSNGLCWYLIAYCLSVAWGQITTSEKAYWLMPLLIPQKLITLPLVLLTLWKKTNHLKQKALQFALLSLVCLGVAWFWASNASAWFIGYDDYNPAYRDTQTLNSGVNPKAQLDYIIGHPWAFLTTTAHSFVDTGPAMLAHFVGKFGWEKNYLPSTWIGLLYLVLILIISSAERTLIWREKVIAGMVVLVYVCLFSVTMYALWFRVGAAKMDNWQGRYFIAIAPLVAFMVANKGLEKYRYKILQIGTLLLCLSNFWMLATIIQRYWLF